MKIQLAYKFTGENKGKLLELLGKIKEILEEKHDVYIPALNKEKPVDEAEILIDTFRHIDEADVLVAIIRSNEKSEGMLLEIGYALGKNKEVIAIINKDVVGTRVGGIISKAIIFSDEEDLLNKMRDI